MNIPLKKFGLDNKKRLLIILAVPLLVYLDYAFVLKPQLKNVSNAGPRIQKLKSDLSAHSAQFSRMQEARDGQLRSKEEALLKAERFISEGQIPALLEDIAKTAKESGAEVIQMKPLCERPSGSGPKGSTFTKFNLLSINLSLSCGYYELNRFLNALEAKDIFIVVEELAVSPQQKDYFKHKVELALRAYVERKP